MQQDFWGAFWTELRLDSGDMGYGVALLWLNPGDRSLSEADS